MSKRQVPINQHYVWQQYLKPWNVDGKVWWYNKKNHLKRNTPTKDILREKQFYKLHELNINESFVLGCMFIRDEDKDIEEICRIYYNKIISLEYQYQNPDMTIDQKRNMFGENIMTQRENAGGRLIEDILKTMDVSHINSQKNQEDTFDLYFYITTQYFRTKKRKEEIKNVDHVTPESIKQYTGTSEKIDWEHIWNYGMLIYSLKIAYRLVKEAYKILIVSGNSSKNLITSDQPVINIIEAIKPQLTQTEIILYYPLTPKIALIIQPSTCEDIYKTLDDSIVENLNNLQYKKSKEFVIEKLETDISQIIKN